VICIHVSVYRSGIGANWSHGATRTCRLLETHIFWPELPRSCRVQKSRAGHDAMGQKWKSGTLQKMMKKWGSYMVGMGIYLYLANSNAWSVQHVEPTLQRQQWAKIRWNQQRWVGQNSITPSFGGLFWCNTLQFSHSSIRCHIDIILYYIYMIIYVCVSLVFEPQLTIKTLVANTPLSF
jgi:hypothetical protein